MGLLVVYNPPVKLERCNSFTYFKRHIKGTRTFFCLYYEEVSRENAQFQVIEEMFI